MNNVKAVAITDQVREQSGGDREIVARKRDPIATHDDAVTQFTPGLRKTICMRKNLDMMAGFRHVPRELADHELQAAQLRRVAADDEGDAHATRHATRSPLHKLGYDQRGWV
jgi:uncharacterized protein YjcR